VPEYRRSMACPNKEETNSAVMVTFQVRAWADCSRLASPETFGVERAAS